MFERFSKPARQVVVAACAAADRFGVARLGPEHLLLGVAAAEHEVGARVLAGFGLDAATLERTLIERDRQAAARDSGTAARDRRAGLTDDEVAALRAVGIDAEEVLRRIEEAFGDTAWFLADDADQPSARRVPAQRSSRRLFGRVGGGRLDGAARKAIVQSLREAQALKHRSIGTEHILLGLLAAPHPPLADLLTAHGLSYRQARQRVLDALRPAT